MSFAPIIAAKLGLRVPQDETVLDLLAESATIPFIARYRKDSTGNLDEVQIQQIQDEQKIVTAGIISAIRQIFTKKNEPMMFVSIQDLNDSIEIVVFPRVLQKTREIWQEGKPVLVAGKISFRNDSQSILIDWAFDNFNLVKGGERREADTGI